MPSSRTRSPLIPRWLWALVPFAALGCGPAADAEPASNGSVAVAKGDKVDKQDKADKEVAPGEKWVRIRKDKDGKPIAMETAIVRYVKSGDIKRGKSAKDYKQFVDLVGAVHVGDRAYYDELNRRFKKYDAVLYELVAPEGTQVPRGRGTSNAHPLGALQNGMKNMLEVEHQLEQIDYTADNMIHADISPAEFMESMTKRDEGFVQMYFRMMGASMAQQSQQAAKGESAEVDMMAALFSKDRPRLLKIAMARQFESMEQLLVSITGPDGSTIITERNNRALDVLQEQLDDEVDRIAIFYGAGHLSEMNDELAKRFDMKPVDITWVEAWNLRE